ncbi:MAG: hypothetical protein AM324_007365 [Candidatus Thorarchaeota archaeon SMTZ1-83]|nr:MAG: hypothetical protein AM324_08590 [Candidatus Thorarchaeota archaeon SMTZ1-83]
MLQLEFLDLTLDEIVAFFQNDQVVAWVLIGSGVLAAAWLLENITDPVPLLGTIFDGLVAISTYLGFFVGILDMCVGYVVYAANPDAIIVAGVLILAGFALSMRLLSKFPIALLLSLGLALFGTFTLYGFLAPMAGDPFIGEIVTQVISFKWMAVIAFVIFAVVYLLSGLLIKLIQLIGRVFAATPVIVLIGLAAIGIGVIIFLNPALVGLGVPWP